MDSDARALSPATDDRCLRMNPSAIMLAGAAAFFVGAVNGGAQVPALLAQVVKGHLQRLPGLMQLFRAHAGKWACLRVCLHMR